MQPQVVLAFSGGLDTSFCVPYLIEKGYRVVTLYVDTGGSDEAARAAIRARALELGAAEHVEHDASGELWEDFVVPFVMGGVCYQDRYPLLCSDRYAIAARSVSLAREIGAKAIAHGCTAMGNDQVRFDQSLRCLSNLPIIAPIRELQGRTEAPRAYEAEFLEHRGFSVPAGAKRYTMNENLLGATISGSEIDRFEAPSEDARVLTAPPAAWPSTPIEAVLAFEEGRCVALDGHTMPGAAILAELNARFGACGVGRGIYTGDTVIGLKGRIVFEAPGLTALLTAHKALEEITLSKEQNGFKPAVARRWTELVYSGFYFEPLRADLEAFLTASQRFVTGEVTLSAIGGQCHAVRVRADEPLTRAGATYAQHADWSAADAEGFIRLLGNSSAIACQRSAPAIRTADRAGVP
jgi:argininosuccinate synthase